MSNKNVKINISGINEEVTESFKNIPIYKINVIMQTAAKITNVIEKVPNFLMTAKDAEIVLDIVRYAIEKSKGGRGNGKDTLEETE